jgi:tRNA modification GTPase
MKTYHSDTIAAIATPPGYGGVGIIRVSGSLALNIAQTIIGVIPKPRAAEYHSFKDEQQQIIDKGIVLYFKAPHSFTGEDVIEFQGHGGPVVLDMLLKRIIALGARIAKPGEFSERAYLNDKIDLAQAEAIADLINSHSEHAARGAIRSLEGDFSVMVHQIVEQVTHLRMYVEAAIDFPDEEVDFLTDGVVLTSLNNIIDAVTDLLAKAKQGALLQEGINIVIAGKPNAGKSSLLNRLSGKETAIVTDVPGTTRDILKEYISIGGIPAHIYDTAGLRETDDVVEKEGVKRALKQIQQADIILLVFDGSEFSARTPTKIIAHYQQQQLTENKQVILVCNKIDKTGEAVSVNKHDSMTLIQLSAKTGEGIDSLQQSILAIIGCEPATEGTFIARRRHVQALNLALQRLQAAQIQFEQRVAGDLLAEDLREVQGILGEITGFVTADDLLGRIFSSFCIGK